MSELRFEEIIQKIYHMEKALEDLRISIIKEYAKNLPVEEVDEETLKDLEKRFMECKEGKAKLVSADEAIKILTG